MYIYLTGITLVIAAFTLLLFSGILPFGYTSWKISLGSGIVLAIVGAYLIFKAVQKFEVKKVDKD
ncbi:hypothetical protein AB990_15595 [Alkalihalobacillus pseudalcaliphilus]|nr:hypothetical protein AB990_15595 [Alkalihalobacillus pseudalcaliphilus]